MLSSRVSLCLPIFLIFDNFVSRKLLVVERNELKYGLQGVSTYHLQDTFAHIRHVSFSQKFAQKVLHFDTSQGQFMN